MFFWAGPTRDDAKYDDEDPGAWGGKDEAAAERILEEPEYEASGITII